MGLDLLEWTTGSNELAAGADAAVGIGIMGAIGAAAAGLTDYHDVGGEQARRVGAMHALLNTGALVLFSFSLLYRLRGARSIGRTLGFLGGATTLLSGHLGGELVFGQQIGVDHTATIEPPDDFTKVLAADALKEGEPQRAEANGVPIVLVRQHDHVYALAETCSHQGGPLSEGTVEEGCIICPWHGSRYAVDDGSLLDGPSTYSQPAFETRIREGQIEVRPMRERAPESVLRLAA
jgi:nitrite reductase/ring-hydroxylating ferredoxin subunit